MKKILLTTALAAVMATPSAFARHRDRDYGRDQYRDAYDYAEVIEARPIYREVRVSEPRRECWDEQVPVRRHAYNDPGAMLLGAIAGGVIGHQFGNGNGRHAATAAGALIGASVGAEASRQRHRYDRYDEHYASETRCRTSEDWRYEQQVHGYDVTYRYGGRVYHTRMPYDPGRRIPVDVNVRPVAR